MALDESAGGKTLNQFSPVPQFRRQNNSRCSCRTFAVSRPGLAKSPSRFSSITRVSAKWSTEFIDSLKNKQATRALGTRDAHPSHESVQDQIDGKGHLPGKGPNRGRDDKVGTRRLVVVDDRCGRQAGCERNEPNDERHNRVCPAGVDRVECPTFAKLFCTRAKLSCNLFNPGGTRVKRLCRSYLEISALDMFQE